MKKDKRRIGLRWRSGTSAGKGFRYISCKDHESKEQQENWSVVTKQVQVDDLSTHPSIHQSFVASGRCIEPAAPACMNARKTKILETEGAHTDHTGAPWWQFFVVFKKRLQSVATACPLPM